MTPEQKRVIKSTILECRKILEADIEQVLINYGIYINSPWVNVRLLQNITEEDENIRKKIEEVIKKLEKSGLTTAESVKQYIKEIVYTYVNRLSALRVLEVRGLIEEVLIPRKQWGDRSYGHLRFYEIARDYCKYQSDIGLAYFIQLIFGEISEEIRVLFNTNDEYSLINPSSEALISVIDLLCNQIEEDAWKQDEIIGWIYQYFNEKEKDEVFDRLYKKKQKIKAVDIPAATQLFTPDWIVKWIVDNSLGTLWKEIKEGEREGKKLEEIRLLDPACGSGHFLVQAYDLFYKLYVNEGYDKEKIPYLILQNNLYGIDIDLRAIQLTALILFIKVKVSLKASGHDTNTKGKLCVNLVCADSVLLNGTRLERLKSQFKKNPTISKMIDIIYEEFKDTRLKGSLIQPEKRLYPLFEEYKDKIAVREFKKLKKSKKSNQDSIVEMLDADSLEEYKSKRNWTKEEEDLLRFLDLVYKEAIKANDITQQMFANEAVKSVKLIDIFIKEYDIVVTNPPYAGNKNVTQALKNFLDETYKDFKLDLYTVFMNRCLEFTKQKGFLGMITQASFMFKSNFESVREYILNNSYLTKVAHLGPHAFDDIGGEKVNTVMFIAQKVNKDDVIGNSLFFKLVDGDGEYKKNLLNEFEKGYLQDGIYSISQFNFKKVEGKPFLYWVDSNLINCFDLFMPFEEYFEVKQGLKAGDTVSPKKRIVYHWEINSSDTWVSYTKGGKYKKFYGNYEYKLDWSDEALDYYKNSPSTRLQGHYNFFDLGISYSGLAGKGFSARILPFGFAFDAGGASIFTNKMDIFYGLGFINSSLASYFASILNPSLSFEVGDVKRIPFKIPSKQVYKSVIKLAKRNTRIISMLESIDECSPNFIVPFLLCQSSHRIVIEKVFLSRTNTINDFKSIVKNYDPDSVKNEYKKFRKMRNVRPICFEEINSLIDSDRHNELDFLNDHASIKKSERTLKNQYSYSVLLDTNDKIELSLDKLFKSNIDYIKKLIDEYNKNNEEINKEVFGLYDISDENRVKIIRDTYVEEYNSEQFSIFKEVFNLISFIIGCLFGRWQINELSNDDDGILPIGSSIYEDDIVRRIYECIYLLFGDDNADNIMEEIEQILGMRLDEWLIKEFFKEHIKKYQKRPIYWHICSPKKTFNCFVYYHKLDHDSLYKVKSIYLAEMINRYKEDLFYYREQIIKARDNRDTSKENEFKSRCNELELKLDDLNKLNKEIDKILPYTPDIDEGVLKNIIPLEPILSATVSNEKEREDNIEEDEEE